MYTDERGQHTTATIAIPAGRFAITSPVAGAPRMKVIIDFSDEAQGITAFDPQQML